MQSTPKKKTKWFPKAFGAGFQYSAVVVAKNIFRDISVKNIVNKIDNVNFTVQFFDNKEDALKWILDNSYN